MRSDQIEFFMSCAACLNFSLAAKYHFVSVSTLSRGISALEDELGMKLFKRGYHGHELTEAGKAFFEDSMEAALKFTYFVNRWGEGNYDTVIIGCTAYDGSFERLISAYSRANADYLSMKLKVQLIPNDLLLRCLDDGIISIALVDVNENPDHHNLSCLPFCKAGDREYVFLFKDSFDSNTASRLSRLASFLK